MSLSTQQYRIAPGGGGGLGSTWADKPHSLIYDLCNEVDSLREELRALQKLLIHRLTEDMKS